MSTKSSTPRIPSVVLRDTFRQCFLGAICLVLAEYMLRLDLSRFFVALFAVYAWILLCLFRINAARVIGAVRKRIRNRAFRDGGGLERACAPLRARRLKNPRIMAFG